MPKAARIAGKVVLWGLTLFLALVMFMMGSSKVAGTPPWPEFFEQFGYPKWFLITVGLSQASGALLLLVPKTAHYGAGLLAIVMAGATVTELTRDGGFPSPRTAFIYMVLLIGIFTVRFHRARHRAVEG